MQRAQQSTCSGGNGQNLMRSRQRAASTTSCFGLSPSQGSAPRSSSQQCPSLRQQLQQGDVQTMIHIDYSPGPDPVSKVLRKRVVPLVQPSRRPSQQVDCQPVRPPECEKPAPRTGPDCGTQPDGPPEALSSSIIPLSEHRCRKVTSRSVDSRVSHKPEKPPCVLPDMAQLLDLEREFKNQPKTHSRAPQRAAKSTRGVKKSCADNGTSFPAFQEKDCKKSKKKPKVSFANEGTETHSVIYNRCDGANEESTTGISSCTQKAEQRQAEGPHEQSIREIYCKEWQCPKFEAKESVASERQTESIASNRVKEHGSSQRQPKCKSDTSDSSELKRATNGSRQATEMGNRKGQEPGEGHSFKEARRLNQNERNVSGPNVNEKRQSGWENKGKASHMCQGAQQMKCGANQEGSKTDQNDAMQIYKAEMEACLSEEESEDCTDSEAKRAAEGRPQSRVGTNAATQTEGSKYLGKQQDSSDLDRRQSEGAELEVGVQLGSRRPSQQSLAAVPQTCQGPLLEDAERRKRQEEAEKARAAALQDVFAKRACPAKAPGSAKAGQMQSDGRPGDPCAANFNTFKGQQQQKQSRCGQQQPQGASKCAEDSMGITWIREGQLLVKLADSRRTGLMLMSRNKGVTDIYGSDGDGNAAGGDEMDASEGEGEGLDQSVEESNVKASEESSQEKTSPPVTSSKKGCC